MADSSQASSGQTTCASDSSSGVSDRLRVLVYGTLDRGVCDFLRMGAMRPALEREGIELRAWSSFADDALNGGAPPVTDSHSSAGPSSNASEIEHLRALGMTALAWCDVVVFRRWTLTHIVCTECGRPESSLDLLGTHLRSSGHRSIVPDLVFRPLIELLATYPELLGSRGLVYETDDDILSYPDWTGLGSPSRQERDLVLRILAMADLVTVSTPTLARRCERYTRGEVRIIRNAVDPRWYETTRPEAGLDGDPRIVYHGVPARLRDYDVARPAVDTLKHERPGTTRVWIGAAHEPRVVEVVDEALPWAEGVRAFAATLADSRPSIGLAPLIDEPFNRAKSELHWVEYALAGAPTIVTGFAGGGPYDVVRDGVDGLVARSSADWLRHLRALAGSSTLRQEIAGRAGERVRAEYDLGKRATEWADAYRWAAENGGRGRSRPVPVS
jgi:glycosyltransferase involved in cell wall biosynthesis